MVVWWIFTMTRKTPHFVNIFCSVDCTQLVRSQAAGSPVQVSCGWSGGQLLAQAEQHLHTKLLCFNAQVQRSKIHEIKRLLGLCPFFFINLLWLASWWGLLRAALFAWCWRGGLEPALKWPLWLAKGQLSSDLAEDPFICQAVTSNGISQEPFSRLLNLS